MGGCSVFAYHYACQCNDVRRGLIVVFDGVNRSVFAENGFYRHFRTRRHNETVAVALHFLFLVISISGDYYFPPLNPVNCC